MAWLYQTQQNNMTPDNDITFIGAVWKGILWWHDFPRPYDI